MALFFETSGATPDLAPAAPAETISRGYGFYITAVLILVYVLWAADMNIMAVLLVPIQTNLNVSDTAMGALTGTAFSIVYGVAGLPLAQIADRGNRRNLIAWSLTVWSAATAISGLAGSFVMLLLARIGVGAGVAGLQPGVLSTLGDLHPPHRRGISIGILMVGSAFGTAGGAILAGVLNDMYGWRMAFLALGLPGLAVAALVFFTVSEPARGRFESGAHHDPAHASIWSSVRYLMSIPTVPRLLLAKILLVIGLQGMMVWTPAFFMRVHHLTAAQMSVGFGLMAGGGGMFSYLLAGLISDRLSKRGERWRSYYCAGALLAGIPCIVLLVFAPSVELAFFAQFMLALIAGGSISAAMAAGLGIVPPAMRGLMTVAITFCTLVIGGGLGPVLMGGLNDWLKTIYGDESLRYAMLAIPAIWALAAAMFYVSGRTSDRDAAVALRYGSGTPQSGA